MYHLFLGPRGRAFDSRSPVSRQFFPSPLYFPPFPSLFFSFARLIWVSFLIRTSGKEYCSQAGLTILRKKIFSLSKSFPPIPSLFFLHCKKIFSFSKYSSPFLSQGYTYNTTFPYYIVLSHINNHLVDLSRPIWSSLKKWEIIVS